MSGTRSNATFGAAVGVVLFAGAGVIALVLAGAGAPGAVSLGVLLAALPVAPLVVSYLWLDRYEPEPRSLLLLALGWGAFVATSAAMFLQAFDAFAFGSDEATQAIVTAPLTEEAAKGLFIVLLLAFRRAELDGILDGIVYAGMVGIGFAFTENILYLAAAYVGDGAIPGGLSSAVAVFVVRGILSPFAHPFFTAFLGIGAGLAVSSRSRPVRVLAPLAGYALAVTAHGLWNASMLVGGTGSVRSYVGLMVPAFLVMVAFAVWARRREGRLLTVALTDCARRGFLDAGEVPWLARLPARRACRVNARRAAGEAGHAAMERYQSEAIELAFLHHRFLRGTPPPRYREIGQAHVQRMAVLRPQLVWPQGERMVTPR